MDSDSQKVIDSLVIEVAALKARLITLEEQVDSLAPTNQQELKTIPIKQNIKPRPNINEASQSPTRPTLSENFIGGKLLNRIGALIVIFAMAYFLKWSFDNHLIGELGRCVLGLVVGVGLMAAGQFYMRKKLPVFAQGLTGAGIAIIYLSSYAAVNYYHLISPYMAFTLMFLTAISSGVLAATGNMPGTAVMATIGGFLVPFLMGSHTGQIIPLLTYAFILDLGILFLAYYRKWFFLDIIALAGTGLICLAAYNMDWKMWAGQAFLTGFLILFMGVSAIYNWRTRNNNLALLIASTLFFVGLSFVNLQSNLTDWAGLISLSVSALYLIYYLTTGARSITTPFFGTATLVITLVFALLTAPLQLDGVYCLMAWLAVAAVLLYICNITRRQIPFALALLIIASVSASVFAMYTAGYSTPVINKATLILVFCVIDWLGALLINQRGLPNKQVGNIILPIFIISTIFYLFAFNINNAIYYYQANQSYTFLIPVSWALVSSLVLLLGVRRDNTSIRLFSLVLFGLVILRTLFYDLRQLDIAFKIMVLLVIGLISLAISFFYQKRMKGDISA